MYMMRRTSLRLLIPILLLATVNSPAQSDVNAENPTSSQREQQASSVDVPIESLSLEQLMDLTVTSASKKEENLSGAPAAIYVITNEDIRRGGFSSLADVLRVVPGMTVQHVNSHTWTVSTRGFNGFPNEKMLVLIDGRAVYDPLYGGVNWDTQALRLEDIDRIEVIRGPGGALWGANAVNGVINVVSKSASQTQGLSLASSLGQEEGYQGSVRFGDKIGRNFSYRVYGRSSFWDPFVTSSGQEMFNAWHISDGGLRADWQLSTQDNLGIDAGGYQGRIRDTAMVANYDFTGIVNDPYGVQGGHILGRWSHTFSPRSSTSLLSYCDWTNRTDIEFGGEFRTTCDIEFQHNYEARRRHSFIWGGALRSTSDQTRVTFRNHFGPPGQRLNFLSAFGQYEFQIVPDRWRVMVGSKFEHSTYGGFDIQPQARAVWTPAKNHNLWGAVSRSARVPTRNERDNFLTYVTTPGAPPAPPTVVAFVGRPKLRAEYQMAYELGYRYQFRKNLSFDAAAFYNSYSRLIYPDLNNLSVSFNPDPPYVLAAMYFNNLSRAQTHGLELSTKWRPISRWQLSLGVTENRGTGISMYANPSHQFSVQSRADLPKRFQLDSALYHWNPVSVLAVTNATVPTGNRVDVGLSWRGLHGLSIGLWGRNLQADRHAEGSGSFLSSGEVRRAVVVKLSWDMGSD